MIKRLTLFFLSLILFSSLTFGQEKLTEFSGNRGEYINQLETFMTSSKRDILEEVFDEYQKKFQTGVFSDEEFTTIIQVSNLMLNQRMTASPYFSDYLKCLNVVKSSENGAERFNEWHDVLNQMLADIENRKLNPFKNFLSFSINFFNHNAIRYSSSGMNWMVKADDYSLKYEDKVPFIEFKEMDLVGFRKKDSISIIGTSGAFNPVELKWTGKGGKVYWKGRFENMDDIYAELGEYSLEVKKSIYKVASAKLHHPELFPNGPIEGAFEDKVSAKNNKTGSSYPRFESKENVLNISNIGAGVQYKGGFRLNGSTVYGWGTKENKAQMVLYKESTKPLFKVASELFTIRKGELINGESVETVMFFDQDSIYHPSLNFKFDLAESVLKINRGKSASDRTPFFNSFNQMNINTDRIDWYVNQDSMVIGSILPGGFGKGNKEVTFESLNYFDEGEYRRIQSIADYNPIATLKVISEKEGTTILDADFVAKKINNRFTASSIQTLLFDLVAKGFINYDSNTKVIEVKDKVKHFADASRDKVDYDVMRIVSETDKANAVFNTKTKTTNTYGVKNLEFSQKQKVAVKPTNKELIIKGNRDIDFDGKVFAGFGILEGKDYSFNYEGFHVDMDSVRYFDLFVPTGEKDEKDNPIALSLGSRIEHTSGVLLIDAPNNKSGKEEIEMFPSFESKGPSYVYYDDKETQGGAYTRDSFYFELAPFSFMSLDSFVQEDIQFTGDMVSSDIFPKFKETLLYQEDDSSLGFVTQTPANGQPNYLGKGTYKGEISLSNKGFLGKGNLAYLGASINSEDLIFKPKQLTCSAEQFHLDEDRSTEVPQADGFDVSIDWRPYKDSMYVKTKERPFDLFKDENHTLAGTMILTPGGLKGRGNFNWDKGTIQSKLFDFGAYSLVADTSDLQIKSLQTDALAFDTRNVHSIVDFDKMEGRFKANGDEGETTMPYNQYSTTLNEFIWDMNAETVKFIADENQYGTFTSIHPNQDSLQFQGQTAFYNLKTNQLQIGGVPKILAADAFVYPDSGAIEIREGGVMATLENAKIVANTENQYHVINKATVRISGKKDYKASGYYEYNIGPRKQEILFANIIGERIGKGKRSEKPTETRAMGEVKAEDNFYIDHKTEFRGQIALNANSKNLQFDGFAKLAAPNLTGADWFELSAEADKNNMIIAFDEPKTYNGDPVRTGIFLSKEKAIAYPRVMMPTYFRKDRAIIDARGFFKYEEEADRFLFGDSLKVISPANRGKLLVFNNSDASVTAEGPLTIGTGLDHVKVTSAGKLNSSFNPEKNFKLKGKTMTGVKMGIPDKLVKMMVLDIKSSSFDTNPIDYNTDTDNFYTRTLGEFIPDNKALASTVENMKAGGFKLPKKYDNFTFFFSNLPLSWDPDYQSFISSTNRIGIASIDGEPINSNLVAFVEFKMPANEDDRAYIYIKSPSDYFYFFGYKQGVLSIGSNNQRFNDELGGMKSKELIVKGKDGETFEIQPVDTATAERFVRRIQAAKK